MFCEQCGAQISEGQLFCEECGARVGNVPEESSDAGKVNQPEAPGQKKKSKLPLVLAGVLGGVLLIAAVCMAITVVSGSGFHKGNDLLLYAKDESLYQTGIDRIKPVELDDRAYDDDRVGLADSGVRARRSEDGKYLFYGRDYEADGAFDLVCIDLRKKEAEPEKLDSGVLYYQITEDNKVVYRKKDSLYIHDLKDKEKITSDAGSYFAVSEDGKKVLWRSAEDNRLYLQELDLKTDKEKLDSDVDNIVYVSDNLKTIVYEKSGSLYLIHDSQEKEKIASDVARIASVVEDGKEIRILYEKRETSDSVSLMDFISDDMANDDSKIVEPKEEDYQTKRMVDTWWGTREEIDISDEYYQKLDEYREKCSRDNMREQLKNELMTVDKATLCLYDSEKGESETVLEGYMQNGGQLYGSSIKGNPVTVYDYAAEDEVGKVVSMSELWENGDIYSVYGKVEQNLRDSLQPYLIVGNQTAQILDEDHDIKQLSVDEKNDCLYAVTYEDDEEDCEIGKITCTGKELGTYESLYQDGCRIASCKDGKLVYYKDVDDSTGDLYCDENKIDSDVYTGECRINDNGSILYYQDMTDEYKATLKIYSGKEGKKIADDVSDYCYFGDKQIVVLVDYSLRSYAGDLKLYNGKELKTIDTDVTGIVHVSY